MDKGNILDSLKKLGFTERDAKIYMAVLQFGEIPASIIANNTGIKRTTVHETLKNFLKKGLVKFTRKKNTNYYSAVDPEKVINDYYSAIDAFKFALPMIKSQMKDNSNTGTIFFYEGMDNMRRLHMSTLDSGEEVLNYFDEESGYVSDEFTAEYITERKKRKIPIRMIATEGEISRKFQKTAKDNLRKIKIIQNEKFGLNSDIFICSDKIVLISKQENTGILIKSSLAIQACKAVFELAWESKLLT